MKFRIIFQNAGWNLVGQVAGLVVALLSIPLLIENIGIDRFGVLAISYSLIGYMGILDFGIGRALTYIVARESSGLSLGLSDTLHSTFTLLGCVCVVIVIAMLSLSGIVGESVALKTSITKEEVINCLAIIAITVPVAVVTSALRGVLEGRQDFKKINMALFPSTVLIYGLPCAVSFSSNYLPYLLCAILFVRSLTLFRFYKIYLEYGYDIKLVKINWLKVRELLGVGGWMTISNIVSPIMVNMDRMFIGKVLSLGDVTHYVVPYEVASRLLIVPSALSGAIFPHFSVVGLRDKLVLRHSFFKSCYVLALLLAVPCVVLFSFAADLLRVWAQFSDLKGSDTVLRIFAVAIFINGMAYLPFSLIQGIGRSDITARFHIIELLVYIPLLVFLVNGFGIVGAAFAWLGRVLFDAVLLYGYAFRRLSR